MSGTYFDILPRELIPLILCNFNVDKSVHYLIKILGDKTLYRKICVTIFPEMGIYPEKMDVEGLSISWKKLYQAVVIYSRNHVKFDKFVFYYVSFETNDNDEILPLMLWDYLMIDNLAYQVRCNSSDELILFIESIILIENDFISSYYFNYFQDILNEINKKRCKILLEKISTFMPSSKVTRVPGQEYKIDPEGNTVLVKTYSDDPGNINIVYGGRKLSRCEMFKRGYLEGDYRL